jgi:hypothetical protein
MKMGAGSKTIAEGYLYSKTSYSASNQVLVAGDEL